MYLQHKNGGTDALSCEENDLAIYTAGSKDFFFTTGGDFHADRNIVAYSTSVSDIRHKEDLRVVRDPLEKLAQINGYHFRWKKDGKWDVGLVAQEVEEVLPHLVRESETLSHGPSKTVSYDGIHALLVEAIKAQQAQINELQEMIYGARQE